jgi:hypothetical protein
MVLSQFPQVEYQLETLIRLQAAKLGLSSGENKLKKALI